MRKLIVLIEVPFTEDVELHPAQREHLSEVLTIGVTAALAPWPLPIGKVTCGMGEPLTPNDLLAQMKAEARDT